MVETEQDLESVPPSGDLSFDFDGDGVPDLVIKKTNGHTAYVSSRWLIAALVSLATTLSLYLGFK